MDIMAMLAEHDDHMRFNDINAAVPEVSRTGLSYAIARMMKEGLLERELYAPNRYHYSLSMEGYHIGHSMRSITKLLEKAASR
jgi:DNA-binding HxlR family transcriptional regulator